jgi:predicted XRE-type DNA-binding protein
MNRTKLAAAKKRVEAEIQKGKRDLAKDIATIIDHRQMTQIEAAYVMQDAPSQVSLVVTGKLRGFSFERLFRMRALLGAKVRIVVSGEANGYPNVSYIST